MSDTNLNRLVAILREAPNTVYIQPHNVPDPDAIASSIGLHYLFELKGIPSRIVYDRAIEKANSVRMLELVNAPMMPAHEASASDGDVWSVLIDAQRGNANLTNLRAREVAAIDHHEYMGSQSYLFEDIRADLGSCSTIIAQYYFENDIMPPRRVASALLYGIMMDTDNLTRRVNLLDVDMFYRLYSLADKSIISELRSNAITPDDLSLYAEAFRQVETIGQLSFLRLDTTNDSLLGAAADFVANVSGVNIVVAYALRSNRIKLSVRSQLLNIKANELIRHLVNGIGFGGGHDHMAGGFILGKDIDPLGTINCALRLRALVSSVLKFRALDFCQEHLPCDKAA